MRPRSGGGRLRLRWRAAVVVAVLHIVVIIGLVRAFTPDIADRVVRSVTRAFTIEAEPPAPPPPEKPEVEATPEPQAAAAAPAARATPRPVAVPTAPVVILPTKAPPTIGRGKENASGASTQGPGTGAAGSGMGTGAGGSGTGAGGGSSPTVKIAGDINSARDYPRKTRDLRANAAVVIDISVGTDGRPTGCRVSQPSPDADADRITCRLAMDRFRFRPATEADGKPTTAVYRWRQRWFY